MIIRDSLAVATERVRALRQWPRLVVVVVEERVEVAVAVAPQVRVFGERLGHTLTRKRKRPERGRGNSHANGAGHPRPCETQT